MHNLLKTFQECQHYNDTNFSLDKVHIASEVIQGHMRPLLWQNHSSTCVYGPILMKLCMNANIMKTHFFINIFFMLCRSFVIFFTLRPSDLITSLTYVLVDNFFPCFFNRTGTRVKRRII